MDKFDYEKIGGHIETRSEFIIKCVNNPFIAYVDDFLPEEVIDELIKDIDEQIEFNPSSVVDPKSGEDTFHYARNNLSGSSLPYANSPAALVFLQIAAQTIRLNPLQAEPLSIIKYEIGQKYDPHHDSFTPETLGEHTPEAGNRIATALLYLKTPQEGGATDFPRMGISVEAKKNRCVFFSNTHMGTDIKLEESLHGAEPVMRGEKLAVNLWFRQTTYQKDEH